MHQAVIKKFTNYRTKITKNNIKLYYIQSQCIKLFRGIKYSAQRRSDFFAVKQSVNEYLNQIMEQNSVPFGETKSI